MIVRAWNLGEGNSGAREGLAAPRPVDRLRKEDVGRWERLGPRDGSSLRKHGAGDRGDGKKKTLLFGRPHKFSTQGGLSASVAQS